MKRDEGWRMGYVTPDAVFVAVCGRRQMITSLVQKSIPKPIFSSFFPFMYFPCTRNSSILNPYTPLPLINPRNPGGIPFILRRYQWYPTTRGSSGIIPRKL
ncbi:hypothetical protein CEXT_694501 [Caerostris extrusa]|uniref:Ycf15 n=1 Tax=Caerostris extrusa TaxID=172846 RepID=A0AAV4S548_CAEEX|nr:hypothetical protein CEXT_694501 [Caerostris extrusa]